MMDSMPIAKVPKISRPRIGRGRRRELRRTGEPLVSAGTTSGIPPSVPVVSDSGEVSSVGVPNMPAGMLLDVGASLVDEEVGYSLKILGADIDVRSQSAKPRSARPILPRPAT